MEREQIRSKIKRIVARKLGKEESNFHDKDLFKSLGADSIDLIEILMFAEDEFKISIPDEKSDELNCIEDYVEYISSIK